MIQVQKSQSSITPVSSLHTLQQRSDSKINMQRQHSISEQISPYCDLNQQSNNSRFSQDRSSIQVKTPLKVIIYKDFKLIGFTQGREDTLKQKSRYSDVGSIGWGVDRQNLVFKSIITDGTHIDREHLRRIDLSRNSKFVNSTGKFAC